MFRPLTALALFGLSAAPLGAAEVPTFEKDILPVLTARCVSCHGETDRAGLDIRTRAALVKGGKTGPALVPGSLKDSLLWLNVVTDKMPTGNRPVVPDAEKDLLRRWIVAGAPGEGVAAVAVKSPAGSSGPLKKRGPSAVALLVDAEIAEKLRAAKVSPSPLAADAEFLRRVCLDLTGRIPSLDRTVSFLASKEPDKRAKLVEELLASAEFGQHFAGRWSGIITGEEPYLRPGLEKWLAERFNRNVGWDVIVRDLIAATGTGPETSFILANVENKLPQPNKLTGALSRLFLGVQLQCAECHNHPFVNWKQTDYWAVAAFFSQTRAVTKTQPPEVTEAAPVPARPNALKGAQIAIPVSAGRAAGKNVAAKFLGGETPTLTPDEPFRPALAAWVTSADNPYFARAAVNRLWAHFLGRGLVNPVDDIHDDNPPTHPAALRGLADEFRASGFDLKHLVRCIVSTQAYQRSSKPLADNKEDSLLYSRMAAKVMSPEALYDSLVLALGVKEIAIQGGPAATSGSGGNKNTTGKNAVRDRFVRFFSTADPEGATTEYSHGIPQALSLMNDPAFAQKTTLLDRLIQADPAPARVVEGLFLALLNRPPTEAETSSLSAYVAKQSDSRRGYAGILWVLVNTPEFILIR